MNTKHRNTKPTLNLAYSRFQVGIAGLLFVALLAGCGGKPAPPTTPDIVATRLQNNPNLSPAAQQAALQSMQAHQNGGRIRAQVMQRSLPQH